MRFQAAAPAPRVDTSVPACRRAKSGTRRPISRGHSARAAGDSINPPDRLRGSITAMTAALGGGRRLLAGEIELAEVVSPLGMPACRGRPMRQ